MLEKLPLVLFHSKDLALAAALTSALVVNGTFGGHVVAVETGNDVATQQFTPPSRTTRGATVEFVVRGRPHVTVPALTEAYAPRPPRSGR